MAYTGPTFKVEGLNELRRSLTRLQKKTVKTILGKSVRASAKPMKKQVQSNAPVRSGSLRRSLIVRVKRYRNGNVVAAIGPRWGGKSYKATKRKSARTEDAYYAWMVEGGTKGHQTNAINAIAMHIPGWGFFHSVYHPGMKATRFMDKAFGSKKGQAEKEFTKKAWAEIQSEARKAMK